MTVGMAGHRERFLRRFPGASVVINALRSSGNPDPLFFFDESGHPDLKGYWYVIGRLGQELEAVFSLRGEILFAFGPYSDFQRRSYNALTSQALVEIRELQMRKFGEVRFTPDARLIVLFCSDESALSNVTAWNAQGTRSLVAPLTTPNDAPYSREVIASGIAEVLASRDLYKGRNPVTGSDFFGRKELLHSVMAELKSGRSVAIFGLRRSGKTSVLREISRRLEPARCVVVQSDLEAISEPKSLVPQIAQDLVDGLNRMKSAGVETWVGSEGDRNVQDFAQLASRIVRVAEKNPDISFVFALDEIEALLRLAPTREEEVRAFLGALRRAAQTCSSVSLLFAGLTTELFDRSLLPGNLDNPLFGYVDCRFLGPFSLEETTSLVRDLGLLMLIHWTEDALIYVHQRAGGMPFLVRDLASVVVEFARRREPAGDGLGLQVGLGDAQNAYRSWRRGAASLWSQIVDTLDRYHPMMATMIRARSSAEIAEWLTVGPEVVDAAVHLEQLGLLLAKEGFFERAPVLDAMRDLSGTMETMGPGMVANLEQSDRLLSLISQGESSLLEFKSTSRWNLAAGKKDEAIEGAIVKTVAGFLNAAGGTLLVGVTDEGEIRGVSEDLQLFNGSRDRFERWLRGDLLCRSLGDSVATQLVEVFMRDVRSHLVVEIVAQPSREAVVWVESKAGESLFVRNGNETRQLSGREIEEFVRLRTGRRGT